MSTESTESEEPEAKRTRRERMFAVLPTLLTLGNLVSGFAAIGYAAELGNENSDTNNLFAAGALIFLAMLFDAVDGSAARWANQTSDFGAQLDSLCDAVSFGVAPAFLVIQFSPTDLPDKFLWPIATLFVIGAILRLARFNVETDEEDDHNAFSGLPSPAAAGTIAAFAIAMPEVAEWEPRLMAVARWGLPLLTLGLAILMVSRLHYVHVFNQLFRGKRSYQHVLQLIITLVVVFTVRAMALPLIFCAFAFWPPLRALWVDVIGRWRRKDENAAETSG